MPTIKDILSEKGSSVLSTGRDSTVLQAAELMNEHRVGSVLVVEGERIEGIFTERDVLRRVVGARLDPAATRVKDVMTKELACGCPDTSVEEARAFMRNKKIRHLPVIDADNKLHGLISIGDLNAYQLDGQEKTIHYLHQYLYGQT
jgi:CBS domain-containing protein